MYIHVYTSTHAQDATFLHADTTCVYLCIIATEDMGHRPQRPGVATVIRACSPPRTGHRPPTYGKYPNGPPDVRRDCMISFPLSLSLSPALSLSLSLYLPPYLLFSVYTLYALRKQELRIAELCVFYANQNLCCMVSIQILPLKIFSVSTLSLLIFLNIRHHA
jgi:hypothetical protein